MKSASGDKITKRITERWQKSHKKIAEEYVLVQFSEPDILTLFAKVHLSFSKFSLVYGRLFQ
jgi:hypothetical protein